MHGVAGIQLALLVLPSLGKRVLRTGTGHPCGLNRWPDRVRSGNGQSSAIRSRATVFPVSRPSCTSTTAACEYRAHQRSHLAALAWRRRDGPHLGRSIGCHTCPAAIHRPLRTSGERTCASSANRVFADAGTWRRWRRWWRSSVGTAVTRARHRARSTHIAGGEASCDV